MDDAPKWIRDLKRLVGVRRQFVFEGNIRDKVLLGRDLLAFGQALRDTLFDLRYSVILEWNQVTGLAVHVDPDVEVGVARALGEVKRVLELNGLGDDGRMEMSSLLRLSQVIGRLGHEAVSSRMSVVLIVDYASRLVRAPDRLETAEHEFFVACERAVNEARAIPFNGEPRFNPIIWLCNRVQDLPSWFLLDNPGVHSIAVSPPDHDTRHKLACIRIDQIYRGQAPEPLAQAARALAALTEGMRLAAVEEIASLARKEGLGPGLIADAVKSYQLGDLVTRSPWRGDGLKERLRKAEADVRPEPLFSDQVMGQPAAAVKVADILKRSAMGLTGAHAKSSAGRPRGVLFLAGPTGVGKTETAKAIARLIFGDERALLRFDMSEFSAEHADARLIGAPPGYVGFEAGGELTNALRERPYRIILFDEIEKANPRILDKFLQVLEDGRLTDGRGETVYFSESLIIFTSNLGIYVPAGSVEADEDDGKDATVASEVPEIPRGPAGRVRNVHPGMPYRKVERRVRRAIGNHFRFELNRPEILNRIGEDNIVVFDFIRRETAVKIFAANLRQLILNVRKDAGIELSLEPAAERAIREHCVAELDNGGRGIGARLESAFTNPLARALFASGASVGSCWRVAEFMTDGASFEVKIARST